MKFIFTESFPLIWNGYTARNNKGISGSHTVSMYLAEGLAKSEENDVTIVNLTIEKEKKVNILKRITKYRIFGIDF